jgi:hypothetical protein
VNCQTADCRGIATTYVTCEGEGAYPYCDECTEVLTGAGHEQRMGPVEIPDEMVKRAAEVLWWAEPWKLAGYQPPADWETCQELAKAALSAALHCSQEPQRTEPNQEEK